MDARFDPADRHERSRCQTAVVNAAQRARRALRRAPAFASQFGEDCLIWRLLGEPLEGFYIEVGAFDGRTYSVTSVLDAAGWNGLLIEAIPDRYRQCVKNRPDARVVHAALGPPGATGSVRFHVTQDVHGGMLSFLDPLSDHAGQVRQIGKPIVPIDVPFTCMDELLRDHTGAIDVAVIDVEGGEVPLLRGFDLRRFRPRLMLIEDNDLLNPSSELARFMHGQDYVHLGTLEVNRVYVHRDEREIIARAGA